MCDPGGCAAPVTAGFARDADGKCQACPVGTYRALGAQQCMACGEGRIALAPGSRHCSFCSVNFVAVNRGARCAPCPRKWHTLFPGSSRQDQCMPPARRANVTATMFSKGRLAQKLVKVPALEQKASRARSGGYRKCPNNEHELRSSLVTAVAVVVAS